MQATTATFRAAFPNRGSRPDHTGFRCARSVAVAPERAADRLSASYLVALAARAVREVGDLVRGADRAGKRLATLSLDTQVSFRSAADRAKFTRELTDAVSGLVARCHDADAPWGRAYRPIVVAHPLPRAATQQEDA